MSDATHLFRSYSRDAIRVEKHNMPSSNSERDIVNALLKRPEYLTPRQIEWLNGFLVHMNTKGRLSKRQLEILVDIGERAEKKLEAKRAFDLSVIRSL